MHSRITAATRARVDLSQIQCFDDFRMRQQRRFLLFILAAVQFTHVMDFVIIMPLGPQLMRVFAITPGEFGWVVSSYTFSAAISGIIGTFFLDRFDRKNSLLALYAGFLLGTLICALSQNYSLLLFGRVIAGAFGGMTGATIFAIIGDAYEESERGVATGTIMSAFSLASILGIPFGLYLASQLAWQSPFYLLVGVGFCVLCFGLRYLPPMRAHLERSRTIHPLTSFRVILFNANHWVAFGMIVALMFAGFSILPYMSPYLVSNVGLREADLPYIYLSGGTLSFLTSRWIGRLADRYGKKNVFTLAASLSMIPVLLLTHLPHVSVVSAVVVTTLLTVFISGRSVPALSMITSSIEAQHRGSFMSFTSAIQQMSSGLASIFAGMVIGQSSDGSLTHYDLIGWLAVGTTGICIILARRLRLVA